MPSCVVKSCSNNSGFKKKSQGITFHRFPKENEVWRRDWINIIRESRSENDWVPSKSSVVCSIHFDSNDLYTTKGGLLRVITYAVPKKYLFVPPNKGKQQAAKPNISSALQRVPTVIGCGSLKQPLKFNESSSLSTSLLLSPSSSATGALASSLEQPLMSEQSGSQSTFLVLPSGSSVPGALASSLEQPLMSKQYSSPSTSLLLPPDFTRVGPIDVEFDLEQPSSIVHTPWKCRMKEDLTKKEIFIQNQKKKIKTLNQKVRRLQRRNKSLKDISKTQKIIQSSTSTQQDRVQQIDPDDQSDFSLLSESEDWSISNLTESNVEKDDQSDSSLISEPEDSNVSNLTESNVDKENSSAVHNCESCFKEITAVRYVCLVCSQEWCEGCEARGGQHADHYVLRVPTRCPLAEVNQVQSAVREALTRLPVWKNIMCVNVAQKTENRKKTNTKKTNKHTNKLIDAGIDQRETLSYPIKIEFEPLDSPEPVAIKQEVEDNSDEVEVKMEFDVEEMDPLEENAASAYLQNFEKGPTTQDSKNIPSSQLATPSQVNLTSQVFQVSAPSQNTPLFLDVTPFPEDPLSRAPSSCEVGSLSQVAPPSQRSPPTKDVPPSKRSHIDDHCLRTSTRPDIGTQENKRSNETFCAEEKAETG